MNTTNSDHEFIFSSFVLSHNAEVHATSRCTHGRGYTPSRLRTEQETIDVRPGYGVHSHSHRSLSRHWLRLVRVLHCVIVNSARILFPSTSYCAELDRLVEPKRNKLTSTTRNNNVTMKYGTRSPKWQMVQHFFHFHKFTSDPNSHTQTLPNGYILQRDVLTVIILPVILRVAESRNFHI